jgi:hypothetical protein
MTELIEMRARGKMPVSVCLHLVDVASNWRAVSPYGIVTVQVEKSDSLGSLDLRALHGLSVTVSDYSDDPQRFRKVAKMVGDIETSVLVMATETVIHIRRGTETVSHNA